MTDRPRPRRAAAACLLPLLMACAATSRAQTEQRVRFITNATGINNGQIDVRLFTDTTPLTVENFLNYVTSDRYDFTLFHRSVPGFVLQTGAFTNFATSVGPIPTDPPVVNEFSISNTLGTLAMAKVGGDPDSATSSFFFNTADNSANLDNQNGGFTVFGEVIAGLDVVLAIDNSGPGNTGVFTYETWANAGFNPPSKFAAVPETPLFSSDGVNFVEFVVIDAIPYVVPEPTTGGLLAIGGLLMSGRRRR